jgi:pimeloyl-ACP methyl ester carboxylesterase
LPSASVVASKEWLLKQQGFLGLETGGFHRVAYTEWGEPGDDPTVVCVHGLSRNGRDFDYLAAALAEHRHVVCPDLAGRGRSEWLAEKNNYGFPTYCADLTALFARLGGKSFDWVGTSLGGLIGMVMAAQPNTPIRRLVINDAGPFISKAAPQRILEYLGKAPPFSSLDEAELYFRDKLSPYGKLTDEQWAHLTRYGVRKDGNGGYLVAYDPGIAVPMRASRPLDVDMWEYWDRIECPVLLLRGMNSDVLSPETAEEMCRRGPPTELVEFENIGHAPALMDPAQIDLVKDWLVASGRPRRVKRPKKR